MSDRHDFEHTAEIAAQIVYLPKPAESIEEWEEETRRYLEGRKDQPTGS